MNIGIDVDGVLVDIGKFQLEKGADFFKKNNNLKISNPTAYNIEDIFCCTPEARKKFWSKYLLSYCMTEPMIDGCSEVISKLHNDGHKIFIITSRVYTTQKNLVGILFRRMLKHWLKKNHIHFDTIVYCSDKESAKDKLEACLNNKIDIIIDDTPENLLAVKENVIPICYPAVWNADLSDDKIIRLKDWSAIYGFINQL